MSKKAYRCPGCGEEVIVADSSEVPDCCGEPMNQIPLEDCTKAANAESARFFDEDGACDDGVK